MEKIRDLTLPHRRRSGRRSKLLSPGGREADSGCVDITEEASVLDVADLSFDSCDDTNQLVESTHELSTATVTRRKRSRSKGNVGDQVDDVLAEKDNNFEKDNSRIRKRAGSLGLRSLGLKDQVDSLRASS